MALASIRSTARSMIAAVVFTLLMVVFQLTQTTRSAVMNSWMLSTIAFGAFRTAMVSSALVPVTVVAPMEPVAAMTPPAARMYVRRIHFVAM